MARPDHYEIAVEQYVHWQRQGLTRREMLFAVGDAVVPAKPSAEYTVHRLAFRHEQMLLVPPRERAA
jgi:hypothetical protein